MQLQSESNPALNTVTAYGEDYIEINAVTYRHAVCFGPEGEVRRWSADAPDAISTASLRQAAGLAESRPDPMAFLDGAPPSRPPDAPEVLLIGTGSRQRLLPAGTVGELLAMGIGVEAMSTQAAARTYNILMAEGRRVVAALLPLEPTQ
ncbi:Mth938-like domain-containing protein [Pusillimonas sp.]|uniref:Mth938-like domain-containing protein n=1 Tax=Pusillimonas sp. TaxID=3040095 RepID=UPI0029B041A9|nr:MTH938/NDUFAF3 family protein [Pusillimonas sp.]MDX3894336.1 MTH938/NDUFAF3 family protein [Pusillimonas sp.]